MTDTNFELKAVPTRIITPKDDIVDIIEHYTKQEIGANDVVSVAESVVAISQGKVLTHYQMRPRLSARIICRFFPQKSSVSSIYGMEALMLAEGEFRVILAFLAGAIAKLFGTDGVFYRLAGRQAALIDDVTGTMPPFDKTLVYGPENPDGVADAIKQRFGCHGAVVADVNDLKRSLIVGATAGLDTAKIARLLIDNPFGNASQRTPIVILKNYALLDTARAKQVQG